MPSQRYTHALPHALLPVAPQLAALHATRGAHDHFCATCGHHPLATTVRRSTHPALGSHAVASLCSICGHLSLRHFDKARTASSFPSAKNRRRRPTQPQPQPQTPPPPPPPINPPTDPKKKSALAELLQRNRQNRSASQPLSTALSAFLTTL